jgi:CRP-like cAMP-binding protein
MGCTSSSEPKPRKRVFSSSGDSYYPVFKPDRVDVKNNNNAKKANPNETDESRRKRILFLRVALQRCATIHAEFLERGLQADEIDLIATTMYSRTIKEDKPLFREGEVDGKELYIVKKGLIQLFQVGKPINSTNGHNAGDVLGDEAFLYHEAHQYSAFAKKPSEVFVLEKGKFDEILKKSKGWKALAAVDSASILKCLSKEEIDGFKHRSKVAKFSKGDIIIHKDDKATGNFSIILSGTVELRPDLLVTDRSLVDLLGPGDYFGEDASILRSSQPKFAIAMSDLELCSIPADDLLSSTSLRPLYDALAKKHKI